MSEPPLLEVAYSENVHDESQSLDDFLCTDEEALHLLENLDTGKVNGPDNISVHMLKERARRIHLFNLSTSKGKFPRLWKTATVVPIPKSSNKHSLSGYRPISLLPIVSKMLENDIHSWIFQHLDDHSPISDAQWGFQGRKSTVTALVAATHDWLTQLDQMFIVCF